jgi:LysM repeat protein
MRKNTAARISVYVLVVIGLLFFLMGCAQKPVDKIRMDKASTTEQEMTARRQAASGATQARIADQIATERRTTETKTGATGETGERGALKTVYVVKKGDSLWWIAKYRDIYNDPYLWPILYDANNKVVKNPARIYPGMKLQIPRTGYAPTDIQKARQKAGARKPYNPPARAVPPVD